jgi:hypothetical protein
VPLWPITFSHGGRSESSLFINLTDVGIELIKEAVALSSVQGDDRLLRPGRNVDKERQHLYYIARQVGLSSGGLGVTLTQLPAMHARFRREGTLPGLTE